MASAFRILLPISLVLYQLGACGQMPGAGVQRSGAQKELDYSKAKQAVENACNQPKLSVGILVGPDLAHCKKDDCCETEVKVTVEGGKCKASWPKYHGYQVEQYNTNAVLKWKLVLPDHATPGDYRFHRVYGVGICDASENDPELDVADAKCVAGTRCQEFQLTSVNGRKRDNDPVKNPPEDALKFGFVVVDHTGSEPVACEAGDPVIINKGGN